MPRERVAAAFAGVHSADALLVIGSSLMVYSGYRFAEAAAAAGKPVAAVNMGRTRADHLLAVKLQADCAQVLREICDFMAGTRADAPAAMDACTG